MTKDIKEINMELAALYRTEKELNDLIKDIVKAIVSTASVDTMSKRVYRYLKEHFGECTFGLAINNFIEKKITNISFYENDEVLETEDIHYDEGEKSKFLETVFLKKEIINVNATSKDFYLCNGMVPKATYFSPLIVEGDVIGAFSFQHHTKDTFTEEELRVCRELIPFLTISLNNSLQKQELLEVNQKLKNLSQYDDLTGLYNRRCFYDNYTFERSRAKLKNRNQYILLMDLDNFKGVNDNFGHEAGDEALIKVGDVLKRYFDRKLLGRFGGDEFIGGMIGGSCDKVKNRVENIITDIKNLEIPSDKNGKNIGISIGVLQLEGDLPLREYFDKVDKLMYRAKIDGKAGSCME